MHPTGCFGAEQGIDQLGFLVKQQVKLLVRDEYSPENLASAR